MTTFAIRSVGVDLDDIEGIVLNRLGIRAAMREHVRGRDARPRIAKALTIEIVKPTSAAACKSLTTSSRLCWVSALTTRR